MTDRPHRPTLHTKEEAAAILRVRVSWLERRAAGRQVPFTMLGGCYMFTDEHLAEIVRMNEQEPVETATEQAPAARRRRRLTTTPHQMHKSGVTPLRARPKNAASRVA